MLSLPFPYIKKKNDEKALTSLTTDKDLNLRKRYLRQSTYGVVQSNFKMYQVAPKDSFVSHENNRYGYVLSIENGSYVIR